MSAHKTPADRWHEFDPQRLAQVIDSHGSYYCGICNVRHAEPSECQGYDQAAQTGARIVDAVERPPHYLQAPQESIETIEGALGPIGSSAYRRGNVLKYLLRARHKGQELQDLKKAEWYLSREIQKSPSWHGVSGETTATPNSKKGAE